MADADISAWAAAWAAAAHPNCRCVVVHTRWHEDDLLGPRKDTQVKKLWIGRCGKCDQIKLVFGKPSKAGKGWRRCGVMGCGGWTHGVRGDELAAARAAYTMGGPDAVKAMHATE